MPLKSLNDLLVQEVRDIYSAEKQITKALPKMAKAATNQQLAAAFEEHLQQTKQQIEILDQVFGELGVAPRAKFCKGMEGLLAEGEELLEEQGKAEPAVLDSGLIAAAQKVEHYEIASYGTVRTWAEQLGLTKAGKLLQQILDQESQTNEKLTQLAMTINQQAEQPQSMQTGTQG
jgi:ferritin-like metal-binding protein YciE